jgi:hypothetical protein
MHRERCESLHLVIFILPCYLFMAGQRVNLIEEKPNREWSNYFRLINKRALTLPNHFSNRFLYSPLVFIFLKVALIN